MRNNFTRPRGRSKGFLPESIAGAVTFLMRVSSLCILLLVAALRLLQAEPGYSQTTENTFVTIQAQHVPLRTVLSMLEKRTDFLFVFPVDLVGTYQDVTVAEGKQSVKAILDQILGGSRLAYRESGKNIVIFDRAPAPTPLAARVLIPIKGRVTDKEGAPMPGVNVVVKGTTYGTSTDANGDFLLEVPEDADIFVFSFIGYRTVEMKINGRTQVDVVMELDATTLQEVPINGGYYITTNRTKTGSITKVTAKEIGNQPVTSPLLSLQGRVPGLEISPISGVPGSAVNIRIRGQNSLRSLEKTGTEGSQPLYIIDGVQIDPTPMPTVNNSIVKRGFDPLSTINPANIESVEILKDADATAIYGSRGANGVIIITTKNRKNVDRVGLDVNVYRGTGEIVNNVELLNTKQYLEMNREAIRNTGATAENIYNDPFRGPNYFPSLLLWDTTRYTSWQDVLMGGKSNISDVQVSFSVGSGRTALSLGGAYHKETLMYPGDFGYHRYTGMMAMNHASADNRFSTAVSLNYGVNDHSLFNSAGLEANVLRLAPNAPRLYNEDGSLNWEIRPPGVMLEGRSSWVNPMSYLRTKHDATANNVVANAQVSYELLRGLSFKANLGYSRLDNSETINTPISSQDPYGFGTRRGTSMVGENNRATWIAEPQLNYSIGINDHKITALLGSTWQHARSESRRFTGTGYTSDALLGTLAGAVDITSTGSTSEYRYASVFGRVGYNYKEKYLINLTGRRDGSSRFGPDRRFGNFVSVGAGWIFTNERLFENLFAVFSHGKIRGSYGTTGNDQISDSNYLKRYQTGPNTYHSFVTLVPVALFNPDYAWEVTKKLEVALELGLFKNVITAEVAWYRNRSSNQLIDYSLPATTGFSQVNSNFDATVQNTGLELSIVSRNIDTEAFNWTTSFNISMPKNELVSFPGIEDSPYYDRYKNGESLSIQRGYLYKGVNPTTGLYDFVDVDGDGSITPFDQDFIGTLDMRYYGGLMNTFVYNGLELSFLFQFSDRRAKTALVSTGMPGAGGNQPTGALDRWQREGDVTDVQRFATSQDFVANDAHIRWTQSAATFETVKFIRLKTLTLSYRFPTSITERIKLDGLNVFVQGQNLLTFSDYEGWDPETLNSVPPLRILSLGINLKL